MKVENRKGASITLKYYSTDGEKMFCFSSGLNAIDSAVWAAIQSTNSEKWEHYRKLLAEADSTALGAHSDLFDLSTLGAVDSVNHLCTELSEVETLRAEEAAGRNRPEVISACILKSRYLQYGRN